MISLLAVPVTIPVLIACCTIPEKVSSSGILNSRCQLEGTDVDVEKMVVSTPADDIETIGSLFVTGGMDMLVSIGDVGKVETYTKSTGVVTHKLKVHNSPLENTI